MDILEVHLSKGEVMTKQEAIKIINKVGEDFGWQMGKVGANYENGYMKAIRDVKNAFEHIVEANKKVDQFREDTKKVVTNADRIRNSSDEELAKFIYDLTGWGSCSECDRKDEVKCGADCSRTYLKWLKEKVE